MRIIWWTAHSMISYVVNPAGIKRIARGDVFRVAPAVRPH